MIKPNQKIEQQEIEIALEIYKQKYEVFRHFDRLRWQIPGLTIAIGAILLTLSKDSSEKPEWWALCMFGFVSFLCSFAISRIRKGIELNYDALKKVADKIGDHSIQPQTGGIGATGWLVILLFLLGILMVVIGLTQKYL